MNKMTVAEARRMRNISQDKVAEYLGISPNGYRKKELGESKFYIDEAYLICELFNMSLDDIYFGSSVAKKCNE